MKLFQFPPEFEPTIRALFAAIEKMEGGEMFLTHCSQSFKVSNKILKENQLHEARIAALENLVKYANEMNTNLQKEVEQSKRYIEILKEGEQRMIVRLRDMADDNRILKERLAKRKRL